MTKQIFIASNSLDISHVTPVAESLTRNGYEVVRYDADKVAMGERALILALSNQKDLTIEYDGHTLHPEAVAAAWNRRPNSFGLFTDTEDKAARLCLDREASASQQALLDLVPDDRWLNSPDAMRRASHKLTQLALARSIGFEIPTTVTSNECEAITSELEEGKIVYKPFYGELYEGNNLKLVYTTVFENDKKNPPLEDLQPYPGIWQNYIKKAREWRLTIVGDECFDTEVHTSPDAKDDWRRHQMTPAVEFRKGEFPIAEKEKCFELLGRAGLRFGTFDFIEREDSSMVYLEMNPNGQYIWLEDILGLPISRAVGSELQRIANSN